VEQNRGAGYESIQLNPTLFLTNAPKTCNGEKTASSINVSGKSGYLSTKPEIRSMFITLY
jgi:hypothetical protein